MWRTGPITTSVSTSGWSSGAPWTVLYSAALHNFRFVTRVWSAGLRELLTHCEADILLMNSGLWDCNR